MKKSGTTFEGYSYRTSARFGSRVTVQVTGDTVSVTGPRIGLAFYRLWIAIQVAILALVVPVLALAAFRLDWRFLVAALMLLVSHFAVGGIGAGCLWELQNVTNFVAGNEGESVSFSVGEVEEVCIGEGWARRGMWLMLLPYFKAIDQMAQGVAVSFVAPDGTSDGGVYAIQLHTPQEAQALTGLLQST